jgi:hypothetical protein
LVKAKAEMSTLREIEERLAALEGTTNASGRQP